MTENHDSFVSWAKAKLGRLTSSKQPTDQVDDSVPDEVKEQIFETEIKPDEMDQYLPKVWQEQMHRIKGQLDRTIREKNQLRKEVERLKNKRNQQLKQQAEEQKEAIKTKKQRMTQQLIFDDGFTDELMIVSAVDDHQFFTDGQGRPVPVWRGIEFTPRGGNFGFQFLVTTEDPEDNTVRRLPANHPIPFQYFMHIIDWETFLTDARLGKVPVYLDLEGDFTPPQTQATKQQAQKIQDEDEDTDSTFAMNVYNILENTDPQSSRLIKALFNKMQEAQSKKKQLQEDFLEAKTKLEDTQSELETVKRALNDRDARIQRLHSEKHEVLKDKMELKAVATEANIKAAQFEDEIDSLWSAFNQVKQRLEDAGMDDRVQHWEQFMEEIQQMRDITEPEQQTVQQPDGEVA